MAKGSAGNDNDLEKKCRHMKDNLEDALNQLDAISKHRDIPKYVAVLKDKLDKVKKYADAHRVFAKDEESLPKRR